jgi:putative ABC transport system permease protein
VGAIVAYLTARAMSTVLWGVPPGDLVTMSLVMLICFAMTIAAAARPAWRAARIQPMSALRAD